MIVWGVIMIDLSNLGMFLKYFYLSIFKSKLPNLIEEISII